jgi:arylsulfatase A-like enzyme
VIGSDIFSTVCEITGVSAPKDRPIDGTSLVPLFKNEQINRKTPMYWRYHAAPQEMKIAMRDGDWKILSNVDLTRFELYNIKDDPKEASELSAKEKEHFERLKNTLKQLNTEIEKEGPDWWKGYQKK